MHIHLSTKERKVVRNGTLLIVGSGPLRRVDSMQKWKVILTGRETFARVSWESR